jgi:acetyl-CoA acetyltransferase
LAKAKKGGFKDTSLDFMVFALLKKLLEKSAIDPNLIEDVCMGNVRPFLSGPSSATSGT